MNITDEIFQVGGSGFSSPEDAAIYLIVFGENAALVDAGCGQSLDKVIFNIKDCGIGSGQMDYLLLTHCHFDHTGGAEALKNEFQCEIIAHELDAKYLEQGNDTVTAAAWYGSSLKPFSIDRKLNGSREMIHLGQRNIEAIHVPGHSPGSVVYLTESEGKKVLFAQDVHGPLDSSFMSNKKDYQTSLKRLVSLEADILCEGHFGIYEGKNTVANFIESFLTDL
ncbi:MAG: MBL fold metallo-hydrolase [Desulfobacterales bacterium]|nr:MBL fold metallo-hydrolase [Deltaproteobacteria bacterium]MBT8373395.1 MBL fold metallo-hydrolase [Deltaproteobacteria bacterium]NNL43304.1 MBL fold metallo-hydrolase [Desulfobacterales bacterium]NNL78246.1 MBL fold metallo-hydrolase [Desulfobacterales bacterium]